ncbi:MAG: lysophospholipid acyltransferase family protein [Gemmatimonadota bacterium]|nr:MAG: lysophospholipid acyltransferase family protein [Gemmatimonadota bacterium]
MSRLTLQLLGILPPQVGERLGRRLGRLAYRLGWRRGVVESQLTLAFPERDADWVSRTARACFEHVGREALGLPRLLRLGLPEVRARLEVIEGTEVLREAFGEGRGVVMVSGHFGNWELAGSALAALGYPVDAVMQRLKNPHLNRLIQEMRERLGMGLIDRVRAWDRYMESLAAGRIVAFVADQDARGRGVFVPFFGRPASTHKAPALLALRTRAPFLIGGTLRVGPRRYHGWIVRLDPRPGLGAGEQVLDLTQRWAAELERRIRLYPEQYFWHHKRWKTTAPGTAPGGSGIKL